MADKTNALNSKIQALEAQKFAQWARDDRAARELRRKDAHLKEEAKLAYLTEEGERLIRHDKNRSEATKPANDPQTLFGIAKRELEALALGEIPLAQDIRDYQPNPPEEPRLQAADLLKNRPAESQFQENYMAVAKQVSSPQAPHQIRRSHEYLQPFKIRPDFSWSDLVQLPLKGKEFKSMLANIPDQLEKAREGRGAFTLKNSAEFLQNFYDERITSGPNYKKHLDLSVEHGKGTYRAQALEKAKDSIQYEKPEYLALREFNYEQRLYLRHDQYGTLPSLVLDRYFRHLQFRSQTTKGLDADEARDYDYLKQHYFKSPEDQALRLNVYGEGEANEFRFIDVAVDAQYAQGSYTAGSRPLTGELQDHSVDQFLIRRLIDFEAMDPIYPELRRLAKPGAVFVFVSPISHQKDPNLPEEAFDPRHSRTSFPINQKMAEARNGYVKAVEAQGFEYVRTDPYPADQDPTFEGFSYDSHIWQVFVAKPENYRPLSPS